MADNDMYDEDYDFEDEHDHIHDMIGYHDDSHVGFLDELQ